MDGTHSLAGLMKWMRRDEWRDPFNELLTLHIGSACADAGVQVEKLDDLLGNRHSDILWGCVFEDFLTIERDEGRNIV
ncbi:MAG TPA: hypothetical protein VFO61_05725, partial [Alphaproteobacteria bacterium]|nr:hypothetical protein [Alphaproteobacteria bacterium]